MHSGRMFRRVLTVWSPSGSQISTTTLEDTNALLTSYIGSQTVSVLYSLSIAK